MVPLLALAFVFLATGCSSVRRDVPRPVSHAMEQGANTALGRAYLKPAATDPGQSGFHLIVSGQEAFRVRATLADAAERTLDLQYYIVAEDATATLLLYRALQAAQRGVRVRLLLDDMYAAGRDFDLASLARHPNMEVRVFNPFLRRGPLGLSQLFEFIGDATRLNQRMHNKLWIADNVVGVFGGRNLGDAYFGARGDAGFADLDVLAAGPVVAEISRSFDDYWNSDLAVPVEAFVREPPRTEDVDAIVSRLAERAERFRESDYAKGLKGSDVPRQVRSGEIPLLRGSTRVIYDKPGVQAGEGAGRPENVVSFVRSVIEKAAREVILVSPYFIPSQRGVGVLCALVGRGVRVRVLTNSLASTDVPVVHAGYARYRPALLACGVELHELRPPAAPAGTARFGLSSGASLHAKAVIVDRTSAIVGSMNLDPRSRTANTEVAVLIESTEVGKQLGELFDEAVSPDQAFQVVLADRTDPQSPLTWSGSEAGRAVEYKTEPLANLWRRFLAGVLGALAPESLL